MVRHAVRALGRTLVVWFIGTVTLLLLAAVLPGFSLTVGGTVSDAFVAAAATAAVAGLLSALLWPLVVRTLLLVPALVIGLLVFALNGGLLLLAFALLPDGSTLDAGTAVLVAAVFSLATSGAHAALVARDDEAYRRRLARLAGQRAPIRSEDAGVVFVQIDGLGHDVLTRALRDGYLPTVAGLLADGHKLSAWRTDWSSQTGASQLGLLHGDNHDIPAFRWYEKDTGRLMVCNHPTSAAELERRREGGPGLLTADGASRGNLFSGGAPHAALVLSVAGGLTGRDRSGYYAYFSDPANAVRSFVSFTAEVLRELLQAARQRLRDVRPRVRRGGLYPLVRAFGTVVERDVVVAAIIGDMLAGRPAVYADLVAYDEVAHHSGTERPETMEVLRRVDRCLALITGVIRYAPRPYRIVVLSDHGQSQGPTFRDAYGQSLEQLVRAACGHSGESDGGGRGAEARDAAKLALGHGTPAAPEAPAHEHGEPVVLASGNLGLISFPELPHRLTLEEIESRHPRVVKALVQHPGVGFVLVRSAERGPLVLGATGTLELATGRVEGSDPLAPFGPGAARAVARTDSFPHCADLMVNSRHDPATGEVHAFEEQVGSHGGLGGPQSHPFLLHPAELPLPEGELVGAEAVHRVLRGWLPPVRQ